MGVSAGGIEGKGVGVSLIGDWIEDLDEGDIVGIEGFSSIGGRIESAGVVDVGGVSNGGTGSGSGFFKAPEADGVCLSR